MQSELYGHAEQSSTEVSTLADDYSSTLTVSDKVALGDETTVASQKVSSAENEERRRSPRAVGEATNGRSPNPVKHHLISDVDSEGIYIRWLVHCRFA